MHVRQSHEMIGRRWCWAGFEERSGVDRNRTIVDAVIPPRQSNEARQWEKHTYTTPACPVQQCISRRVGRAWALWVLSFCVRKNHTLCLHMIWRSQRRLEVLLSIIRRIDLGAAQSSIFGSARNFFGSLSRFEPKITAQQQSCVQSWCTPLLGL